MFTPGAVMSGLSIPAVTGLGPLEENLAIAGAGLTPKFVTTALFMRAVGLVVFLMYRRMALVAFSPIERAGRMWLCVLSSSPYMLPGMFAITIPNPPAARTTNPFFTSLIAPLSHTTILPLTDVLLRKLTSWQIAAE
jgi:hypothetical protein